MKKAVTLNSSHRDSGLVQRSQGIPATHHVFITHGSFHRLIQYTMRKNSADCGQINIILILFDLKLIIVR